jgi:Mce-associated membrane protein
MPPRPRSPRPRPTPSRRPRVAGTAPTAPRPAERIEERPGEAAETTETIETTETTEVAAPDRRSEPAPPAPKAKPKRPRPKPAPAAEPEVGAEPGPEPGGRTERLPVVAAEDAGEEVVEEQAKPAGKPRRKPARSGDGDPEEPTETADADAEAPAAGGLGAFVRRRAVPLLSVAVVLLATVAVVAGMQDARLRGTPAAENTALVDVGTTAEVASQLSDAIETVYSFDFARLDENEKAARDVITPEFAAEFDRLFGEVRARAPQQQAVVSATVTRTAVKEITGDRAVLIAFVDQQATRAAPDAQSQQLAAAGRLAVTGQRVDGHWKIAAVTPL